MAVIVSKIVKRVVSHIIFTSYSPARMQARRRWRHVANRTFNEQRDSDCSLVFDSFIDI